MPTASGVSSLWTADDVQDKSDHDDARFHANDHLPGPMHADGGRWIFFNSRAAYCRRWQSARRYSHLERVAFLGKAGQGTLRPNFAHVNFPMLIGLAQQKKNAILVS